MHNTDRSTKNNEQKEVSIDKIAQGFLDRLDATSLFEKGFFNDLVSFAIESAAGGKKIIPYKKGPSGKKTVIPSTIISKIIGPMFAAVDKSSYDGDDVNVSHRWDHGYMYDKMKSRDAQINFFNTLSSLRKNIRSSLEYATKEPDKWLDHMVDSEPLYGITMDNIAQSQDMEEDALELFFLAELRKDSPWKDAINAEYLELIFTSSLNPSAAYMDIIDTLDEAPLYVKMHSIKIILDLVKDIVHKDGLPKKRQTFDLRKSYHSTLVKMMGDLSKVNEPLFSEYADELRGFVTIAKNLINEFYVNTDDSPDSESDDEVKTSREMLETALDEENIIDYVVDAAMRDMLNITKGKNIVSSDIPVVLKTVVDGVTNSNIFSAVKGHGVYFTRIYINGNPFKVIFAKIDRKNKILGMEKPDAYIDGTKYERRL
jgi:hypothetical protein